MPVERLRASELRSALRIILASPGSPAAAGQELVDGFCEYLAEAPVEWEGLRCGPPQAPTGLFLALLMPGRTAIVMLPNPGEHGIRASDQSAITLAGLAGLETRGLHYAQVLSESEAAALRTLLEQVGFHRLTRLLYLDRDAVYPWVEPPSDVVWTSYGSETHSLFADVVSATYRDSRDCPELTGLRPIDDILASHQASGRFDPGLWEVAMVKGRAAGCLLLARLLRRSALELVYMGVVPEFRRRGIGRLLLRRAFEQCRIGQVRRLTVVVDDRNEPAKRLYAEFGLTAVASREAWLYRWKL